MKNYFTLNIQGLYNDLQPIFFGKQKKKELQGGDYLKLYGALMVILENNELDLEEYGKEPYEIYKKASIQDNELYLENFEGFELDENWNIHTLYLNEKNQIILSVYNNKKDKYFDFLA